MPAAARTVGAVVARVGLMKQAIHSESRRDGAQAPRPSTYLPEECVNTNRAVNLDFVCNVVGKSTVISGTVVSRTPNHFPCSSGFGAVPVTELG
jgi:hypothetical protein